MLTSTAGVVSSDTASAAPVASARTLEADTLPSVNEAHSRWFSSSATIRGAVKSRNLRSIFSSPARAQTEPACPQVSLGRSKAPHGNASEAPFTLQHECVNIVLVLPEHTYEVGMAMSATTSGNTSNVETAIAILRQRFGDRLQTGEAIRRQHANTITWIPNQPPDAVIWVENTEEVREVVRVAGRHRVPIVPFGAGTSLEGHINAPRGGFSLDFTHMNHVLAVNERDLDCVVEPGVSRKQLNDYLHDTGLFFPVDPGAEEATLGGMAATRASGTNAVRYGTMRENVLNLTAVMADGSIVKTAQRARKSAAGYDLTRLLGAPKARSALLPSSPYASMASPSASFRPCARSRHSKALATR